MNTTETRIRRRMFDKGLAVNALAEKAAISRMTLTRRLADPKTFTLSELDRIAEVLDTTTLDLLYGHEVATERAAG